MINWNVTKEDGSVIDKIVNRAAAMTSVDKLNLTMDITATHLNGCRLKLADFLSADDFNFAHDVFGIARHINRETGKLTRGFLPRFAA